MPLEQRANIFCCSECVKITGNKLEGKDSCKCPIDSVTDLTQYIVVNILSYKVLRQKRSV